MTYDPVLGEIRFGCGMSPNIAPPVSIYDKLALLQGPDRISRRFVIPTFQEFLPRMAEKDRLWKIFKKNRGSDLGTATRKEIKILQRAARKDFHKWAGLSLLRRTHTQDGFRERLAFFWADHFTAVGKAGLLRRATSPYVEEAIRPNLTGKFGDMLVAVATQPLMLHYLDQNNSMGPNSDKGIRRGRKAGLNENLAREMLELHTLGVDGPYDQDDVRQLAELLTGLTYRADRGFRFRKDYAEPGAETILEVSYGGAGQAQLSEVTDAMQELARHRVTADHIARKLAVHFVSDTPDAGMVADIAAVFYETEGDLFAVYQTMLEHPKAWMAEGANVKQPVDFIGSTMRALVVDAADVPIDFEKKIRSRFTVPMAQMGQLWERPIGPDGWPEEDDNWVTPQRIAARLQWAMVMPQVLKPELPDPRDFVETALGGHAPEVVRFAAASAESRVDGIGLVLASPAFQRQ